MRGRDVAAREWLVQYECGELGERTVRRWMREWTDDPYTYTQGGQ